MNNIALFVIANLRINHPCGNNTGAERTKHAASYTRVSTDGQTAEDWIRELEQHIIGPRSAGGQDNRLTL
jgi:hypothetical protein